ncbi:hypothetical protein MKZ26_16345 [Sporosarcina sp. FSL K6-6792]|uniref:hypothetical protein n=1 Tax=Sporosarcina sp. FSL K6-6792 TaxID=2921559 RepID=UPI0030F823D7
MGVRIVTTLTVDIRVITDMGGFITDSNEIITAMGHFITDSNQFITVMAKITQNEKAHLN